MHFAIRNGGRAVTDRDDGAPVTGSNGPWNIARGRFYLFPVNPVSHRSTMSSPNRSSWTGNENERVLPDNHACIRVAPVSPHCLTRLDEAGLKRAGTLIPHRLNRAIRDQEKIITVSVGWSFRMMQWKMTYFFRLWRLLNELRDKTNWMYLYEMYRAASKSHFTIFIHRRL